MSESGGIAIGDTVRIINSSGNTMTGQVGTVVHRDDKRDKWLVRVGVMQNYFSADQIEPFA